MARLTHWPQGVLYGPLYTYQQLVGRGGQPTCLAAALAVTHHFMSNSIW
jgi:hypothetical protein